MGHRRRRQDKPGPHVGLPQVDDEGADERDAVQNGPIHGSLAFRVLRPASTEHRAA